MEYLPISFLGGILTVLAPCVFTLLPVILGKSLQGAGLRKVFIVVGSLSVSIFLFTLLIKVGTLFIGVPAAILGYLAGGILLFYGLTLLLPNLWTKVSYRLGILGGSENLLHSAGKREGMVSDILVGVSLGPVFSSCSPTYTLIVSVIIKEDLTVALLNLVVYIIGLAIVLLLVGVLGNELVSRLRWAVNPKGWFKRGLGVLFVLLGLMIITGFDKKLEGYLLEKGFTGGAPIEIELLERQNQ